MSVAGEVQRTGIAGHAHRSEEAVCRHCGNAFTRGEDLSEFCCAGCGYVHALIRSGGLEKFYDLRDGPIVPIGSSVFQAREFDWLAPLMTEAEATAQARPAELEVEVQGISCIGCVWLLERIFSERAGTLRCAVNPARGTMLLCWTPGAFDGPAFAQGLQRFGYLLGAVSDDKSGPGESSELKTRLGLCGAFAMNTMLFTLPSYLGLQRGDEFYGVFELLSLLFAALSMIVGGSYFITRAWACVRAGIMAIDLPIAGGLVVAFAGSVYGWWIGEHALVYFDFVAIFAFLMLVGRWTQEVAIERNRRQLLSQSRNPGSVRAPDGSKIKAEALLPGSAFIVPPGSVVPVNSRLHDSPGTFTLEWINGETEPRTFRPGESVPAGAVAAATQPVRLTAMEPWTGSLLERLHDTQAGRTFRNARVERLIGIYLVTVVALAVLGGIGWWWMTGDILRALPIVVATLVVSCPCAIGVAMPLVEELAVSAARRHGVFVRERSLWPRLLSVRKIIFDKTGTLTLEVPEVANPKVITALDVAARERLWELVATNPHPSARGVQEALVVAGFAGPAVSGVVVEETVGRGVALQSEGVVWSLGAPGWKAAGAPGADLVFARDGTALASIMVVESVRRDARREIAALRAEGYETAILSGDRGEKVQALATQLGFAANGARGDMRPEDKEEWVRAVDRGDTLMLGDGANDSLAFDAASCRGTPAIHRGMLGHKADFYYLGRGLSGVRALIEVARRRRKTLITVLSFTVTYNAVAILAALSGFINPLVAAVAMPASSLISIALAIAAFKPARVRRPVSSVSS